MPHPEAPVTHPPPTPLPMVDATALPMECGAWQVWCLYVVRSPVLLRVLLTQQPVLAKPTAATHYTLLVRRAVRRAVWRDVHVIQPAP